MPEVRAAAGADLHHPAAQTAEQLTAMLGTAAALTELGDPRINAGEHWARGMCFHQLPAAVVARTESSTPSSIGTQVEK